MSKHLLTLWIAILGLTSIGRADDWKPAPGPFPLTRWAQDVTPANALPEYPRPLLVRKDWQNLNGLWDYAVVGREEPRPATFAGQILVPFPIEAPLSGVGKMLSAFPGRTYVNSRLWYRRTFEIPAAWNERPKRRVLLHFGAVDWEATVFVNGQELGVHRGGYDGFSFDITDKLRPEGPNELAVAVWDPTGEGGYPRGKQIEQPKGIFYTPCTGIWQTVWLEPVDESHIKSLTITPDLDASIVKIACAVSPEASQRREKIEVRVLDAGRPVATAETTAGETLSIKIDNPQPWTPTQPRLYDLMIRLGTDEVQSYFAMRKVSIGPDQRGTTRILLNNEFLVHNGVLDQGYWPDGIYTAPTDAALRYDLEVIKQLGFNMSRKHLKVEPERWYYWADKLGVLVWQDMPASGDGIHAKPPAYAASAAERQEQFAAELRAMIRGRFNHPAIVSWIVFNEGMGLHNSAGYDLDQEIRGFMRRMADVAAEDTTRAINAESGAPMGANQGWNKLDIGLGQIMDAHCYGTTKCLAPTKERASVIGEYGYAKFVESLPKYRPLIREPGVSGLVWTQLTDVENERNGLLTYDRATFKENPLEVAAVNAVPTDDWKPVPGHLLTRWAKDVSPASVLPEYPRPQMVRPTWQNLNGLWDYAVVLRDAPRPAEFAGKILVPFCIESALSGVKSPLTSEQRLWYRRKFTPPDLKDGQRLLLHFGAVDWEAKVQINGQSVGEHRGGYDAWTLDVTAAVKPGAENELVVSVYDATSGAQARGKQKIDVIARPKGIRYTPCSGIWQTVWLESVPAVAIESLKIVPDIDQGTVSIETRASGEGKVKLTVLDQGQVVVAGEGAANQPIVLKIPDAKLWSPDRPFLYDLRVEMGDDVVTSYFGMRKISLGKDGQGVTRIMLNNEFVFQAGLLDQGYWPDGIYTAPTDAALRYDIEFTKELGINVARKHVKVEPDRWYYWCDKLGLLVWQDMPSGGPGPGSVGFGAGLNKDLGKLVDGQAVSPEAAAQFETELKAMVEGLGNHPSIIMWIVFNESWGQYDTPRLTNWVKQLDPSRLVNNASGGHDLPAGDVLDVHHYPGPAAPHPTDGRAGVLGEFGGVNLPTPGHTWVAHTWGYHGVSNSAELTERYVGMIERAHALKTEAGLNAFIYTQTTDVETECNGLVTYDRGVIKLDVPKTRAANRGEAKN